MNEDEKKYEITAVAVDPEWYNPCTCHYDYNFVIGSCNRHNDAKMKEITGTEIVSLKEKLDMLLTKFDNLVYSLQLQESEDGKYSKR